MKNNSQFINIICFILLISIHYEAVSSNSDIDGRGSPSIDSLIKNTEVDLRMNYAFFVHHHFNMTAYPKHFPMFELSLQKQTYGNKDWQAFLNYPTIGISAFYSNLGNIDIIGQAYAIYPFINFHFNKSKIHTLGFRFGAGIGYITKKFDAFENYRNTSIGSHVNAAISLTFEYGYRISDRYKISAFAGLTHFSNGCSQFPNSGINIINAGLSTTYLLTEQEKYIPKKTSYNHTYITHVKPIFYLGLSYGVKRIEYNQTSNFSVYNIELYAMDRITNISNLGFGIDIVYDASDFITLRDYYGYKKQFSFIRLLKPGIGIAYELMMGDASFILNFGFHPWGLEMSYGRWYQKLGIKINFMENFYGKIALNTHFGVADFIGFGLGIKL